MKRLIKNIGCLAGLDTEKKPCLRGSEMADFHTLGNAWLLIRDNRFESWGTMDKMPVPGNDWQVIDANGGAVLPSWCDSHTHIVYAGSREQEFVDKINGLSYAEIARRGGGILNSADRLHELSEDELYAQAMSRVREIIAKGTGAVEIKSGYGLNTADEIKMLHVIARIRAEVPRLKVMSTFLGAHAVQRGMSQPDYVDLLINETIPEVGRQHLADFIDVFCDQGFFTPQETDRLLEAGAKWGMRPKIHAEELAPSGGVEVGVKHNALSVDHLESMTDEDIDMLRGTDTIPTALPGTSFFLNMPFAPARKMIEAGLAVATASDYNPGSTPSGDMKFVVSLACIKMRLLPAEALNAATVNTAAAMGISGEYGSIAAGKVANFFITRPIPGVDFIPYAYTTPVIERTFLSGEEM